MIRKAEMRDLGRILEIYAYAREFMAANGNPRQWGTTYPPEALLREDIAAGRLYAVEEDGGLHGVFLFAVGEDPTYRKIEDGAWLSDAEYGVIHRIAGDGKLHGLLSQAVAFAGRTIPHLRIDTHADNKIMQHTIGKNGFVRCGIIHIEDGSPRIAYEKV